MVEAADTQRVEEVTAILQQKLEKNSINVAYLQGIDPSWQQITITRVSTHSTKGGGQILFGEDGFGRILIECGSIDSDEASLRRILDKGNSYTTSLLSLDPVNKTPIVDIGIHQVWVPVENALGIPWFHLEGL